MDNHENDNEPETITQEELDRTRPTEKEIRIHKSTMSHVYQLALKNIENFDPNNLTQAQIDAIVFADTPEEMASFLKSIHYRSTSHGY